MSLLNVTGISKKEGEKYLLKNINFIQQRGQRVAIAGATGSGKTSLLKIIAGLIQPDGGEVWFEDTKVKGPLEKLLPGHSQIAYLSQNFELRSNYKVEELLQMANKLSDADAQLVYEVCRIDHLLNRWSDEVSGGERQRIAFAKTLVTFPKLLLLDEPFSNLDAVHRNILKAVINDIEERLNTTCILVSHDPVDLLSWAHEIIVLHEGKVVQRDSPKKIYFYPVNEYVAALFGKFNFVIAEMLEAFPEIGERSRKIVRPSEFYSSVNNKTGVEGKVISSIFMGPYYEIIVHFQNIDLFMISNTILQDGEIISFSFQDLHEQLHHLE